ncbi:hypothetical protein GCM10010269_54850 [Streptomyces humidus]|uniref:Uncharacterized protein n=1 Tax=Streptomyces humidus TaxID=52259 RepID=A0A918G0Y6_9ACTN|nr:hypothetical protein GCM10010269_54850 [Streptomyces humidus]
MNSTRSWEAETGAVEARPQRTSSSSDACEVTRATWWGCGREEREEGDITVTLSQASRRLSAHPRRGETTGPAA